MGICPKWVNFDSFIQTKSPAFINIVKSWFITKTCQELIRRVLHLKMNTSSQPLFHLSQLDLDLMALNMK